MESPWGALVLGDLAMTLIAGALLVAVLGLVAALVLTVRYPLRRARRAQRRLEHAVETLDQGFALFDANDRLVMANKTYRQFFPALADRLGVGATFRELLEASAARGIYVDAAGREEDWIRGRLDHHLRGEGPMIQQLADGRWLYLVERTTPEGERVGLRVDVTQLKTRERELEESESRFRDLVEGSIQAILIQSDWEILFANQAAADMLGYASTAELLATGRLDRLLAPHEVERLARYRDARREGDPAPARYEVEMKRRDGQVITCDCMVRDVHWEGFPVVQSTLIDITERKRAEHELRAHKGELEARVEARTHALRAANDELEAFAYSVSHDLRAPLRHVRGFAEALAEDCGDGLDATGRDYLARLCRAANRMEQLVDDLLDLSRLSQTELRKTIVDLSMLATEVFDDLHAAEGHGSRVRISIESELRVYGDPRLLRIVLHNLFDNALKYTAREPHARIVLGSGTDGDVRYYYVEDNGAGFDPAYAERLFGPFQRLHSADSFAGHGIGLATVARIIHRHDGIVWARGETGQGATFYFTLPFD